MPIIEYTRRHHTTVSALLLALVRYLHTRAHIRWKIFTKMQCLFNLWSLGLTLYIGILKVGDWVLGMGVHFMWCFLLYNFRPIIQTVIFQIFSKNAAVVLGLEIDKMYISQCQVQCGNFAYGKHTFCRYRTLFCS